MAFVPVPDVAQLSMRMTQDGQQIENVFYVHSDSGWDDAKLVALVDAAATLWTSTTGLQKKLAANCQFVVAVARDLTSDTGIMTESHIGSGTVGLTTSPYLPNNVAFCLHKNAVIGGRHNKGRTYVAALAGPHLSGPNTIAVSAADAFRDALIAFQDGIEEAPDFHVGFVIYQEDGVRLTTGIFVPQNGWSYRDLILDSQRRRLPGRGR